MFNGIFSDVIGRDGKVSETGNSSSNKNNNNSGGEGDIGAERLGECSTTREIASTVGVFERHVTHYHNHVLRMREPAVPVTSSSSDPVQSSTSCRQFDQEAHIPTDIKAPTSVSRLCVLDLYNILYGHASMSCGWLHRPLTHVQF